MDHSNWKVGFKNTIKNKPIQLVHSSKLENQSKSKNTQTLITFTNKTDPKYKAKKSISMKKLINVIGNVQLS